MPRQAKQMESLPSERTLVLDNGAYTMKAGFAQPKPDATRDCHIIPNCIARDHEGKIFIAGQLESCKDFREMAYRRPVEKGYLVNWDAEMEIWKHSFFNEGAKLQCDPHETNLIITEASNCPQGLQINCDQMIFEELEFASYYRCPGPTLNAYNDISALFGYPPLHKTPSECLILIDSGYSHATVTPLVYGRPIQPAIRRLEIGGKFLTNHLKELVSIRHWDLHNDPHVISLIKDDTCFISSDFDRDLQRTWKGSRAPQDPGNDITLDYVLPDFESLFRGYSRPHDPSPVAIARSLNVGNAPRGPQAQIEHSFPIGNERFTVPELLFNPPDVGLGQAGLPEIVVQSLSCVPQGLWPGLLGNVVLVGGSAKMPGFVERLEAEIRSLVPADIVVRVKRPEDPVTYTWLGGARLASDRDRLKSVLVTRQEYQENGSAWTARRFASGLR